MIKSKTSKDIQTIRVSGQTLDNLREVLFKELIKQKVCVNEKGDVASLYLSEVAKNQVAIKAEFSFTEFKITPVATSSIKKANLFNKRKIINDVRTIEFNLELDPLPTKPERGIALQVVRNNKGKPFISYNGRLFEFKK